MKRGRIDGQVSKEEYEQSNLAVAAPVRFSIFQIFVRFDISILIRDPSYEQLQRH